MSIIGRMADRFFLGGFKVKTYLVLMLGLAYAGTKDGRRCWTDPECAKRLDAKSAAVIAASLMIRGIPVQIKE